MGKEHLDLLPQLHRDHVLLGLRDVPGDLPGVLMFLTGDLAGIRFWAAFHFRWAGLAGVLQRLIFGESFASRILVRVRVIAPKLLEWLAFRADVLFALRVLIKVSAAPCAFCTAYFVQHRNAGIDFTSNQPSQHRP